MKVRVGDVWEAVAYKGGRRIFLILDVVVHPEDCRYDEYRYIELTSETTDVRHWNLSIRRTDKLLEPRELDGVVYTHYDQIWKKLN